VNRRLLHWFIDHRNDAEIRELLRTTELWFVISANPDGYQYTFDHERLWRKNLRDNNGDGQITVGDGVDPNRNFDSKWGFDNEGSSPETPASPAAARPRRARHAPGRVRATAARPRTPPGARRQCAEGRVGASPRRGFP
jgi:hypothetical protein